VKIKLKEIMSDHIFNRSQTKYLPTIDYGEGVYLFDKEGRRYLDGSSGALVTSLGHGDRRMGDALVAQANKIAFVHGTQFTSKPAIELAERLVEKAPGSLNRVYFVSGGSEANETAVKIARQYQVQRERASKFIVISRNPSYHGGTLGMLGLTGYAKMRHPYMPLIHDSPKIIAPYCYRCPLNLQHPQCGLACAKALETCIKQQGTENVMAFIAEPIYGTSLGMVVPPPGYYQMIRSICDRYDVIFIADEIMCGIGRTGNFFAFEHWNGVVPDIVTVGKGISGGYGPLAAAVVRQEIYDIFVEKWGHFVHGFTYQANPLMVAAGLEAIKIFDSENLVENARIEGDYLINHLREMAHSNPYIGDVRGKGLMIGIELVKDKETKEPFDRTNQISNVVLNKAFKNGLIMYMGTGSVDGLAGDVVIVAPPLIIKRNETNELLHLVQKTFSDLKKDFDKAAFS